MSIDCHPGQRRPGPPPCFALILSWDRRVVGVAVLVETSSRGFRADVSAAYPLGERLRLEPQSPHPLAGRSYPFVVTRSTPPPHAELGGEFLRELTEEGAVALVSG